METTIFTDIWNHINSSINWTVVLLVVTAGYVARQKWMIDLTKINNKTKRIVLISLMVVSAYSMVGKLKPEMVIASYFFAFGFHAVLLKILEHWLGKQVNKLNKYKQEQ